MRRNLYIIIDGVGMKDVLLSASMTTIRIIQLDIVRSVILAVMVVPILGIRTVMSVLGMRVESYILDLDQIRVAWTLVLTIFTRIKLQSSVSPAMMLAKDVLQESLTLVLRVLGFQEMNQTNILGGGAISFALSTATTTTTVIKRLNTARSVMLLVMDVQLPGNIAAKNAPGNHLV